MTVELPKPPTNILAIDASFAGGILSSVTAERICPTPDDYPIEVVSIDNQETILLRPEHLSRIVRSDVA